MKLPDRLKLLDWLLLLVSFVFFLIPFIGAHFFRSFFSIPCVQWGLWFLGLVNTVVISLGFLLSLRLLFAFDRGSKERKKAGLLGFSFLGLFFLFLISQLCVAYAMIRLTLLTDGFENDFAPKMISRIYSAPTAEEREEWASIVYRQNGIVLPYKLDDGSYIQHTPSQKEKQEWFQIQETQKLGKEVQHNMDRLAHRALLAVMIHVTLFFLIVSGAVLHTAYHRVRKPQMESA